MAFLGLQNAIFGNDENWVDLLRNIAAALLISQSIDNSASYSY